MVSREIRDSCVNAGIKVRVDGPWCVDIATASILQLAVGVPSELLIAGCDLREPLVIKHSLDGVVRGDNGQIAPLPGSGLGIAAPAAKLGQADRVFR